MMESTTETSYTYIMYYNCFHFGLYAILCSIEVAIIQMMTQCKSEEEILRKYKNGSQLPLP